MANVNKVILIGNITRDIEMRYTPSGMAVVQLGLAVNRKWRDKQSNELREETTFVDVDLFGKTAELAQKYLSKGRPVYIEGRLKLDQWDDKQSGQKRSKLKVVAEAMQFLGAGGPGGGAGGGGGGGAPRPARQAPAQSGNAAPVQDHDFAGDSGAPADLDIQEDNIPF